ncbi:DMT family transporter [Trinickia caryophylli]|uniref:Threonine/homoserine efflux transporter RhtA n=1 Tax=Trinickia caryophylli TaxID=28094 RepID=A0A1X7FJC2_TRICW|nr:DMT family transporter [Trinickia caryophylli]WQE13421.1 DMT family transporter [Trinickia caryophylli]SMF53148.1 Threonine/homoserine efflux transporter RhtA [Trinickia caryophylli]
MNTILYVVTVAIWGSTWIGIHYQVASIPPGVSLLYRTAIAAVVMLSICLVTRKSLRYPARDHLLLALQGFCLFAGSYWLVYIGAQSLESGFVALGVSTVIVFNLINSRIFLSKPIEKIVLAGALIGLTGVMLALIPDSAAPASGARIHAILITLAGAYIASVGNIVSGKTNARGISVLPANALSLTYASLALALLVFASGTPLSFDPHVPYVVSLLYLAIFGTVIAFLCYLTLLGRIGAGRAAYAMLASPVIALVISSRMEGLSLSARVVAGTALVIVGNWIIMRKPRIAGRTGTSGTPGAVAGPGESR